MAYIDFEKFSDNEENFTLSNESSNQNVEDDNGFYFDENVNDTYSEIPIFSEESEANTSGMTLKEINDPNEIVVTVANYETPIVVLFGPPACGKTMTLIRLTRYLQSKGYTIKPIESFRPSYDKNYSEMCKNFNKLINNDNAAHSTNIINFMLVEVLYQGRPLCQILEAPGEHYFNPDEPISDFPRYVNAIINGQNRKIWTIFLEPEETGNGRMDTEMRRNYVNKIHKLKTRISMRDNIVFVLNKIDLTPFVITPGNINYSSALKKSGYLYPNIFEPFKNQNPITKLWSPYRFDFTAFQTGNFNRTSSGTLVFQEGPDVYPQRLWELINKKIRG